MFLLIFQGSGKTYSMSGTAANPGINYQALAQLFSQVQQKNADSQSLEDDDQKSQTTVQMSVSHQFP